MRTNITTSNIATMVIIMFTLFTSCSNDDELSGVYRIAGSNKSELKKVISYFQERDDTLGLKVALFMVKNMEYKTSVVPNDSITYQELINYIHSIRLNYNWQPHLSLINTTMYKAIDSIGVQGVRLYDAQILKAETLIRDIELSLKQWNDSPFRNNYSFNDFCKWVFPYKVNDERYTYWRNQANNKVINNEDSIRNNCKFNDYIKLVNNSSDIRYDFGMSKFPITMTFDDSDYIKRGNCVQIASYNLMLLRSRSIPSAIDYIPAWANRSSNHVWNVIIYPDGSIKDIGEGGENKISYKIGLPNFTCIKS